MIAKRSYIRRYQGLLALGLLLGCALSLPDCLSAQNPQRPVKRSLITKMQNSSVSDPYRVSLSSALSDFLNQSNGTDTLHPVSVSYLRRLSEEAKAPWRPDDTDPRQVRHVTQKAVVVQGTEVLTSTIQASELGPAFRDMLLSLKNIQNFFRYSVQTDGESVAVSRKIVGKKLLELNMEFDSRQGLDPQLTIGESLRFRYDYSYERALFEYALDF